MSELEIYEAIEDLRESDPFWVPYAEAALLRPVNERLEDALLWLAVERDADLP